MRASEKMTEYNEGYRRLRSRQSSMGKNQSTSQTSIKRLEMGDCWRVPITEGVQVSEFKLPISVQTNQQPLTYCQHYFGKSQFQPQITQLQMTIGTSIMQAFRKEFIQLTQSFQSNPKHNPSNPPSLSTHNSTKPSITMNSNSTQPSTSINSNTSHNKQHQIPKNSTQFLKETFSNNQPFSSGISNQSNHQLKQKINPLNHQSNKSNSQINESSNQVAFVSFRKVQNPSKSQISIQNKNKNPSNNQISIQHKNKNFSKANQFYDGNSQHERNDKNTVQRTLFQANNSNLGGSEGGLKTEESQFKLGQVIRQINSPSLSLSPDEKQFRRSFNFNKPYRSQIKSDSEQLSLISTEKAEHKKQSALNLIYDQISMSKNLLILNKLIFLRQIN